MSIILECFISGYIFTLIYRFFLSKKSPLTTIYILWSVIISFIIKNIIEIFDLIVLTKIELSLSERFIVGVVIAVISSVVCVKINKCKYTNKLLGLINHKSINDDIWQDIVDYDNGTTLHIVHNNGNISYYGILIAHEEKGLDSWFVLKDYIIEYHDTNTYKNSELLEYPSTIAINLKDIKHIELFYNKDTKIFD